MAIIPQMKTLDDRGRLQSLHRHWLEVLVNDHLDHCHPNPIDPVRTIFQALHIPFIKIVNTFVKKISKIIVTSTATFTPYAIASAMVKPVTLLELKQPYKIHQLPYLSDNSRKKRIELSNPRLDARSISFSREPLAPPSLS